MRADLPPERRCEAGPDLDDGERHQDVADLAEHEPNGIHDVEVERLEDEVAGAAFYRQLYPGCPEVAARQADGEADETGEDANAERRETGHETRGVCESDPRRA